MAAPFDPDLPFLGLETSGRLGSVAVALGGRVLAESWLDTPGNHAAELIPSVAATLARAGVSRADLGGIVVGRGPGSFTGVRISAATGKGLAHALGRPLWAFSSLEAAAIGEAFSPCVRYVLFDAREDRIYAACYRMDPDDRVETLLAPHATRVGDLLEDDIPPGAVFVGSGAVRHRATLEARGHTVLEPPFGTPTASALLRLLQLRPHLEPIAAGDQWEPEYVKSSSAVRPGAG